MYLAWSNWAMGAPHRRETGSDGENTLCNDFYQARLHGNNNMVEMLKRIPMYYKSSVQNSLQYGHSRRRSPDQHRSLDRPRRLSLTVLLAESLPPYESIPFVCSALSDYPGLSSNSVQQ